MIIIIKILSIITNKIESLVLNSISNHIKIEQNISYFLHFDKNRNIFIFRVSFRKLSSNQQSKSYDLKYLINIIQRILWSRSSNSSKLRSCTVDHKIGTPPTPSIKTINQMVSTILKFFNLETSICRNTTYLQTSR